MTEHKMPEPVAWVVIKQNRIGGTSDNLRWNRGSAPKSVGKPAEALYSVETVQELQAEVERLRGLVQERDAMLGRKLCAGTNADGNPRCHALADALRERDALAQDAARLDWLDANGCQRFMGPGEDIRGPNFQWFDFDGARDYAATLRELIDAAMNASA